MSGASAGPSNTPRPLAVLSTPMSAPLDDTVSPTRLLRSRGDAAVGVVVPPGQLDRMAMLLSFTAVGGQSVQVELARTDVGRVAADLGRILAAAADQLCHWWYRLSVGDNRPGALATAENAPAVCSSAVAGCGLAEAGDHP